MKMKTFILTFLLMMSSPFLFGQSHWDDPALGYESDMRITAKIFLDESIVSEGYQLAAFSGDELLDVVTILEVNFGGNTLWHADMDVPGNSGMKIYFKLFDGDKEKEYVSETKFDFDEEAEYTHAYPAEINFKSVAQIEGTEYDVVYSSLQEAIDAAANNDVITLLQDNAENVTVVQAPDVAFTISGAEKTMTGTITVNGKSAAYPTAGLTIKNVNFDATNIADASIMLGVSGNTNTRYTNGVTVQDCNFTGNGQTKAAIKNYTGGCKNITVTGGTFTGLHSLMQVKGVDGVKVSGVTVENCKNGIAVGTSTNVAISGSKISATGYGVRADGEGAYSMTLTDNTISAELPVVVRKAKAAYNLTIAGDNNNYTAYNENAYQVVFTTGDDGTYEAPTTGQFVLTAPENFNVYPVYVAQVGDNKYTSVVTAINEAADGATVQLLPGTIDEYVYPWPESNHSKEKSITIVGAENYGTTLTAGMFLGYDDSQCREHNIVVKGINFTGKGLIVACQQYVTIEGNKFDNITEGRAIAVIGKNINSVVKNNVINNVTTTSQVGIELRNTLTATVEGNTISNTGHNALQITSQLDENDKPIDNSSISVSNNTMSNWGEGGEGRAMRINGIVTATISGNVMSHTAAPEEFVKVTGATTLDVSANYWNGISPLTEGMFAGVEGDLVRVLVSYYTDAEKTNLVTLAPSVAKIGDVYYQSLQKAIDAATEGQTITLIDNITIATDHTDAAKGYFQIEEDDKIIIDLNGKKITVTESATGNFLLFSNYGELTLNDSQSSAVVELTATNNRAWSAQSTIVLNRGGVLNINGGKYVHKGGTDMAITICNSANSFGPAYLYVNGGEIISETYIGVRMRMENPAVNGNPGNDISYMYVTDGYIYGLNRGIWGQKSTGANEKQGELVITGGTIENATADRGAIQFDTDSYEAQNVVATISGDAFIKGQVIAGKDEMSITGGTFTTDVTEYCAFGYTCQANGDGTYGVVKTEGFEIPNLDRLIAFRNAVNAGNTFKNQTVTVTADIDLSSVENWAPIGTEATPFQGTFDGGNFTISNLKINAPETSNVGLFGCIKNGATIKNLTIDNATVNAKSNVGAIAGNLHSSTMDNCHVTGLVQINGNYKVGGLVGTAYSSVRNSSLVADDYSYVKGTHATANLEGDNVGGITGYNGEGVYTYSNNTVKNVTISGTRKVGGILGFIFEDAKVEGSVVENVTIESTATNEYAQENAGKMSIGGIIGQYQTHGSNNGYVNSSVVKNVTFVKGEELDFQVGPLVGGTRNNANFVPSATVTSKDNHVYMTTITGSNNLFLMHAVAKIEETNYYTLEEAIAAANNQTVTVLEDVELRNSLTINVDQTVTLDLNGKTITGTPTEAAEYVLVTNIGILTITDDSETKEGKLVCNHTLAGSTAYAVNTISNRSGGVLTIEAGTIENTSTASNQIGYAIDNYSGSAVIIKGGKVTASGSGYYDGIRQFCNSETLENSVTIEGGEVSTLWIQNPSNNNERAVIGSFEITGGTLNNLFLEPSYNFSGSITGGYVGNISRFESNENDIVNFITGGTFGQDPTAYVAEGYVVKQNADGTYGVFLGVAKIEETGAIYGTLQAAVNAAAANQNIILLADINENVTIKNKKLTIDGGGFNSTGYFSTNISTSYPLTFQNFNIDGAADYFVRVDGGGGNYTFDNCNIKNSWGIIYTNKSTNTVTIKNSTVDNCSYGVGHFVALNSAIIENVTVTNSTRGVYVQNQDSKTVTFKNCNISATTPFGIWEKSTYVITFNIEGKTDVNNVTLNTGDYYKYVLSAEGAKLIGAQEGLDITTTVEGSTVKYEEGTTTPGFGTYSVVAANVELVDGETGASVGKFATIQEAIDAAQTGDVVRIVSEDTFVMDITTGVTNSDSYYVLANVADKEVVIDLNGRTVTVDVTNLPEGFKSNMLMAVFCAGVNGKLTLRDSGENGSVSVIGGATKTVYSLAMAYEGLVNIESGIYSIDYMKEGRGMIYGNVGDGDGNTPNTNQGVNISGGNFTLGNVGTLANGSPWILATAGSNSGKYVYVTGGTYNADILHQHWAFEVLAPVNKALKNNGDGTYSIVDAVAFVKQHEYSGYYTETGYATLEEAFMRAHTAGDIITLLQDITLTEGITVNADQEVVLDLNGKVVSYESATVGEDMITNKGKLTIESNVEGGKLTYNNTDVTSSNVTISTISTEPGSELIINSGIVENTSIGNSSQVLVPYTIDILTNGNLGDVAVTINGGSIISTNYIAIRQFVNGNVCNNSLIVKDGTIQALKRAINVQDAQGAGEVKNCAKLLVEGGNIIADDENGYSICNLANSENISVTGGNFVGQVYSAIDGIITGGTFNMEPYFAYCAEGYAAVDNGNGIWTVMPVQEQSLVKGWNWYSTYLDIELNDLTTALGDNGVRIQSQDDGTIDYYEYEGQTGWIGDLTSDEFNHSKMYMIQTNGVCNLKMAASVVDAKDYPVTLKNGWTWIGYPSNVAVDINVAFAGLEPKDGDVIKTQNNGSADYAYGQWWGSLQTMVPGIGYQYRNKAGEERTFVYNIPSSRSATRSNITTENNYWVPNSTLYPHTMTMTAVVAGEMNNPNYEVAAFVNGELRGSARPIYVEPMDAYVLFLTIHGEDVEEMSFRLYDIDNDTEYDLSDRINYSNNAHLGSVREPYAFTRGTTGIGENAMSNVNIYPNPTTTGTEINLEAVCDKVEVFNALGVKLVEYQNVDSIDALETAGIYVIRITNSGNVQNCRLVVK